MIFDFSPTILLERYLRGAHTRSLPGRTQIQGIKECFILENWIIHWNWIGKYANDYESRQYKNHAGTELRIIPSWRPVYLAPSTSITVQLLRKGFLAINSVLECMNECPLAQQRILKTSSHSKDPVPRKVGELPLSTVGSGYFQVLWSHSLHGMHVYIFWI